MELRQLTGLEVSDENLRETIQRLSYFSAPGAQDYREALFGHLAINALAKFDPGGKTPGEIRNKITELTGLNLDLEYVRATLCTLVQSNDDVYCTENDPNHPMARFGLEAKAISDVNSKFKDQVNFEEVVLSDWIEEVRETHAEITDSELDSLVEDLNAFSYRIYAQHSAESAALLAHNRQEVTDSLNRFDDMSLDEILPERSEKLEAIRSVELPNFFRNGSVERKRYIAQQMNQFFILYMMQLDPTGAALLAEHIEGGHIYLDTNVLFNLFGLNGRELQEATRRLIELSRGLNYRPLVTIRTVEEYRTKIRSEIQKSFYYPEFRHSGIAQAALRMVNTRDSERLYWEQASKAGAYVDPREILEPFKYVDDFLREYDIEVEESEILKVMENEEEVQSEISLLRRTLPGYLPTHEDIPEHDAIHRLFILRLRAGHETDKPLDEKYWFLTTDSKLPVYDRRARPRQRLQVPFCVMTSQWMQLLYPYRSTVPGFDETLATVLDSPLFRAFPSPSADLIHAIISEINRFETIPPRIVTKMITDQAFLRNFQEATTEARRTDLVETYVLEEIAEVENELEAFEKRDLEQQSKIEELSVQLQDSQAKLAELKDELESSTKDSRDLARKVADYEIQNRQIRELLKQAQDEQSVLQRERDQFRERIQRLERTLDEKEQQQQRFKEEIRGLEENFSSKLHAQGETQDAWRRTVTKTGLCMLVVIAVAALFVADNPLNRTGDERWFAATYIVTGLVSIQAVILYGMWPRGTRQIVGYSVLALVNVAALAIVYSKPFGVNLPDAIAWISLLLTAFGTAFAVWSHQKK